MLTPMLLDINAGELLLLAVVAVILFGPEKLPELARKAAQVLQYVRQMAGSAQQQLKDELGPEFANMDFRDLNPKQFVKKHLLEDVDPIIADVKDDLSSVSAGGKRIFAQLDAGMADSGKRPVRLARPTMVGAGTGTGRTPWDPDAT